MEDSPLPPELERMEWILTRGPRPVPSAALRRRVLGSIRSELHRERLRSKWRLAAAFAATLLLGLSLSLGAVQATSFALQQPEAPPSVAEIARRLQQLSPQLSHEESLRQAMLRGISPETSWPTNPDNLFD
jgi:hypothetical protein